MKAFVSWSGGKDCMLALHRFTKTETNEVACLVNMCDDSGDYSRSHGLRKELIKSQADHMGLNIIQQKTDIRGYEVNFKEIIHKLKLEGVTAGVFGDIYLKEHRNWIERVCHEMDITPVFPLWHEGTKDLLEEFISQGFKTITVSINISKLSSEWLGRTIDYDFLDEISKLKDIDPCAENGEYHTFVYDGPLFKMPLQLIKEDEFKNDKYLFQKISVK